MPYAHPGRGRNAMAYGSGPPTAPDLSLAKDLQKMIRDSVLAAQRRPFRALLIIGLALVLGLMVFATERVAEEASADKDFELAPAVVAAVNNSSAETVDDGSKSKLPIESPRRQKQVPDGKLPHLKENVPVAVAGEKQSAETISRVKTLLRENRRTRNDIPERNTADLNPELQQRRLKRIRAAVLHAWSGYERLAFGHDELRPVTNDTNDSWGGLGATLFDALDTLWIAGLKKEFSAGVTEALKVSFDIDHDASFFEFTIRYLGGLLGAFELSRDPRLLDKAREFADRLMPAFEGAHGLPYARVNLKTGKGHNPSWTSGSFILGEIGTFQLEFSYLAAQTKQQKYQDAVERVNTALADLGQRYHGTSHGLFPVYLSSNSAGLQFGSATVSFGGLGDSFFEYLLKYPLMHSTLSSAEQDSHKLPINVDRSLLKTTAEMYVRAIEQASSSLVFNTVDGMTFLGEFLLDEWRSESADPKSNVRGALVGKFEHLTCFVPAMLALPEVEVQSFASRSSDVYVWSKEQRESHLQLAERLIRTCRHLYDESETGIGPETCSFETGAIDMSRRPSWRTTSGKYMLRPEYLESLFVLFRATGNETYRQWAWEAFEAIEHHCKTPSAYSGLRDVRVSAKNESERRKNWDNSMQSFFFSETLKYLLMMFSESSAFDFSTHILTTEGHPLGRS